MLFGLLFAQSTFSTCWRQAIGKLLLLLIMKLLNITVFWGAHFYQFLTGSVADLLVFSTTFAHDSRLRCGVADLYYTLYGRSRPPCLPLPEVCQKFWCRLSLVLFYSTINCIRDCSKIDVIFCWPGTVETRFQLTFSIVVYFLFFFSVVDWQQFSNLIDCILSYREMSHYQSDSMYELFWPYCLSTTSWCSTEMAKHRITQTMLHDSPGTPVSCCQRFQQKSNGPSLTEMPNAGEIC